MAVLNKIRQRSVFLIIIIALALFSFVLADVIRNGGLSSQKSQNTIATINGEEMDRAQFARQVEAYTRNMGPNASTSQAVQRVWEMNLRQVLLQEQLEELGVRVEEAHIKEMMRTEMASNPNFLNEAGMFDENKLQEYVATLKNTSPQAYQQWLNYETSVADAAREQVYFNLVRAGVGATLLEGEQAYRFANDNVDLRFVNIPYTSVPDSEVEVSKAEIKEYMEAHKEQFEGEASRDIRYVLFQENASAEDEAAIKEEMLSYLKDRVEYNAVTQTNDTIQGFGKTEDYESFVNETSDIRYSDAYLFRDDIPEDISDSIFQLQEGDIYGPYKTNSYWNLSRVVEVTQVPDSAKASHILVAFQGSPVGAGVTRTKAEAEALADSIAGVVRQDETKFAELALAYSADASNKEAAGDLGWFTPGTMVGPFNDFVFSNPEGTIGVVETQFGYHVIDIQEQTAPQDAIKLATVSREIQPSEKTLNDLYTKVTQFELAAKEGNFEEVAEKDGLEVRPVKEIGVLEENIPGLGGQRQIVQWAFEEETEAGEIKRFDIPQGYVVVQVTAASEKGLPSVESASSRVIPILQKEKKAEIIKARISGNTLQEIAANQDVEVNRADAVNRNSPVLPGAGTEPFVVGVAFGMEEGEVSEPLTGETGVFVIEVTGKNPAAELESYRSFAARETTAQRTTVQPEVVEALKKTAEIEDNRARFY